jgi:hypothetical protein
MGVVRAAVQQNQGRLQGMADREPFNAIMSHFITLTGVTFTRYHDEVGASLYL